MTNRYHMPAEWDPQQAIWLAWPHEKDDWPGKFGTIPWVYCEIIRHISEAQQVCVLVQSQTKQDKALRMLESVHANLDNVTFYLMETDRVWVRDSGPTFVKDSDGKATLLNWQFNAWAKYDNWRLDNQVPALIGRQLGLNCLEPTYNNKPVVLEGGAIDVNGAGMLVTTKECLLDQTTQTRNPGLSAEDYEAIFSQYLGVDETIWLQAGIVGDDTHGHVDDITRFIAANKVVTAVEANRADDNFEILQVNKRILQEYRSSEGSALEIVELPMPAPLYFEGNRLPASYANFLICNEVVLVPTFNDTNDRLALDILAHCFENKKIVGIHAVDLVWGYGTLHCLSQQQPA